ncbi:type IX secretion system membrane protein PorP/SprF [bacterium]|nr:MAG: type IX secretion system membrane protein PorP/SprF [bacterium]
MLRTAVYLSVLLFTAQNASPQATQLPHQYKTAETVTLQYPVNSNDVRAIGMGNAQIANGKTFNAMMYNPALLGHARHSIEWFGLQAGMPSATYDAANYLGQHIDEFEEALSMNQIWDGLDLLTQVGATNAQRLQGLHDIQDGLVFVNDLFQKVTGPSDNPETHGINLMPSITGQFGHFGFSLYGFGQAGFKVIMSPTFESLLDIEIPSSLDNPVSVARSVVQLTAALAPALIGPRKFSDQVYPSAFYVSYFDIVAAAGYGMPITTNLTLGANLKIINRRFLIDRIAAEDYDQIISNVWDKFKSDVTGVTCDLGAHYQFKFGTSVGASLQNIIPVKEIKKSVETEFKFNKILKYDISNNGKIDSLKYVTWETTITRPFALKAPFIASIGICHPITDKWDIAFDWVDIAENDIRYEKSADRICLGTEYRYPAIADKLIITPRLGWSDQRLTVGLGFNLYHHVQLDGAYAYDKFVNEYAYYAQCKIIW